jgi:hypothetical protein
MKKCCDLVEQNESPPSGQLGCHLFFSMLIEIFIGFGGMPDRSNFFNGALRING